MHVSYNTVKTSTHVKFFIWESYIVNNRHQSHCGNDSLTATNLKSEKQSSEGSSWDTDSSVEQEKRGTIQFGMALYPICVFFKELFEEWKAQTEWENSPYKK